MTHWASLAYLARYTHQPLSELRALTKLEFIQLHAAVTEIVKRENPKKKGG